MALISGTFPARSVGRFAAGSIVLPAGIPVMVGYSGVPHLVEYYRPTATHCRILAPTAQAGLVLAPRSGSARVEGP